MQMELFRDASHHQCRQNFLESVLVHLEVAEEDAGMLQFALDVEGDHPGAACALSLHQLVLRVGRQACRNTTQQTLSLLTLLQSGHNRGTDTLTLLTSPVNAEQKNLSL